MNSASCTQSKLLSLYKLQYILHKYAMKYIWIPFIVNLSSYLNDIIIVVSQFYTRLHTWIKGKVLEIFILNELYKYIVGQTQSHA